MKETPDIEFWPPHTCAHTCKYAHMKALTIMYVHIKRRCTQEDTGSRLGRTSLLCGQALKSKNLATLSDTRQSFLRRHQGLTSLQWLLSWEPHNGPLSWARPVVCTL